MIIAILGFRRDLFWNYFSTSINDMTNALNVHFSYIQMILKYIIQLVQLTTTFNCNIV
jgi:hypothetical protein